MAATMAAIIFTESSIDENCVAARGLLKREGSKQSKWPKESRPACFRFGCANACRPASGQEEVRSARLQASRLRVRRARCLAQGAPFLTLSSIDSTISLLRTKRRPASLHAGLFGGGERQSTFCVLGKRIRGMQKANLLVSGAVLNFSRNRGNSRQYVS